MHLQFWWSWWSPSLWAFWGLYFTPKLTSLGFFVQQLYIDEIAFDDRASFTSVRGMYHSPIKGRIFSHKSKMYLYFFFFARCTKVLICEYNLHLSLKLLSRQNVSVQRCFWTTGIFCLLLTCSLSIGTLYNSLLPSFLRKKNKNINVLGLKAACLDGFYFSSAHLIVRSKLFMLWDDVQAKVFWFLPLSSWHFPTGWSGKLFCISRSHLSTHIIQHPLHIFDFLHDNIQLPLPKHMTYWFCLCRARLT